MENLPERLPTGSEILFEINKLETDILLWHYINSQSNPSAVMELRSMKQRLKTLKDLQLKRQTADPDISSSVKINVQKSDNINASKVPLTDTIKTT